MRNDLKDSFQKAEQINREQEEKLRNEINKEQNLINQMCQEIMWGSSKNSIIFDARKDFGISSVDADLFYKQALKNIEEGNKMDSKINEKIFAKIHRDKLLSEDRKDELIPIITHYFSSKPNVMKKLLARYEAEIKTKTKKQAKGKQNAKAKENDNVVSITTDDSTD